MSRRQHIPTTSRREGQRTQATRESRLPPDQRDLAQRAQMRRATFDVETWTRLHVEAEQATLHYGPNRLTEARRG